MRVGFYIGYIVPEAWGGGSTFQTNVLDAIQKIDTDHELYFFYDCKEDVFQDTDKLKFINIKSQICKSKRKSKLLKLFKKKEKIQQPPFIIDDFIKKYQIELVYFYCVNYAKVSVPYIITVWDLSQRETPFFPEVSVTQWIFDQREKFYSEVLPRAARVVIGNEEGKREVCKYYNVNEDLVETIPMVTPNDVYTLEGDVSILEKLGVQPNKYLYYPAQFWSHKNHIRLLKELVNLKEQGYDFKLVFSGSDQGNQKYIERKTKELGLEKDVIFAGFIKREEVIALYKNAYALTYASHFGPDNIPPLEAMAVGCPVICSEFKGAHEQLQDCALFFNPATGENFKQSIDRLKNSEFKADIVAKGKALAAECTTEKYVAKMFKIIDAFEAYRECWGVTYGE